MSKNKVPGNYGPFWLKNALNLLLGAVHKVRHAREGRGPRRCDSLWQGEGVKSMWRHAY